MVAHSCGYINGQHTHTHTHTPPHPQTYTHTHTTSRAHTGATGAEVRKPIEIPKEFGADALFYAGNNRVLIRGEDSVSVTTEVYRE